MRSPGTLSGQYQRFLIRVPAYTPFVESATIPFATTKNVHRNIFVYRKERIAHLKHESNGSSKIQVKLWSQLCRSILTFNNLCPPQNWGNTTEDCMFVITKRICCIFILSLIAFYLDISLCLFDTLNTKQTTSHKLSSSTTIYRFATMMEREKRLGAVSKHIHCSSTPSFDENLSLHDCETFLLKISNVFKQLDHS